MVESAKMVLEFLITFLIVYICYYLFLYRNLKRYDRKKAPVNVKYLVYRYNLDIVRIGYKNLFKNLMLADSFIVALVFSITELVDNTYLRLATAFILLFPVFAGVYHLIANYYIKKENR